MPPTRVMIIDDAIVMRRMVREALRRIPDVTAVVDFPEGESALEAESLFEAEAVILDLEMPGMDGLEVLRELRSRHAELPIIMLSSAGGLRPQAVSEALDLGAAAFLDKPVRSETIKASIDQVASQLRAVWPHLKVPASAGPSQHVLIVDDSKINRHILGRRLAQLGHTYEESPDGIDAEQCWQDARYDTVLMDCEMPRRDGWETTQLFREFEKTKHLSRARVIAITASDFQPDRGRDAGMDGYLPRPFTLEAVHSVLHPLSNAVTAA